MYKVEVDGHTIHDPRDENFILPYAKVDLELNKTGSFEFDITSKNPGYMYVDPMKSVISVYDDGELIFRGRSTTKESDFYNTGTLKCEGELSYLIDTILRPRSSAFQNQTNRYIFQEVLTEHNSQVEEEKQFLPGAIDVDSETISQVSFNYEKPLDFINANLIEKYGGYLRIRYADGKRYLDWIKQYGKISKQPIRFGYNLLDLKKTLTSTDVCTVVVPVGGSDKKVTVKNAVVNGNIYGKDYIQNDEAVSYFGKIIKVQEFSDIQEPTKLYTEGKKWLEENMKSSLTVELTALDLHMVDLNIDDFKLGDLVPVISIPHEIVFNDDLPVIEKYSYDLTDPSKNTITVGKTLKVFTERKDKEIYERVQEVKGKFEGYIVTNDGKIEEITEDIQEYKALVLQDFTAVNGKIDNLSGDFLNFKTGEFEDLKSKQAELESVKGDFLNFKTGEFETLKAKQTEFENTTTQNITAVNAKLEKATGDLASFKTGEFEELKAKSSELETAVIGKADITDLDALRTRTGTLEADYSELHTLVNGNLTSENIQNLNLTSLNTTIENGMIKNAMIESLMFDKITGFDINTTKFTVHSDDGKSTWADNTIQIADAKRVRVQIGKDETGDYNIYIWDIDGNLMFDPLYGVQESGIKQPVIRDAMISDNANIQGSKLDIEDVIKEVNGAETVIKGSRIKLDEQNQTLNIAFSALKTYAEGVNSKTESNTTAISVVQGQISTLITNTTIVKDGKTVQLKDAYNSTVSDVNSMKTTIGEHATLINANSDDILAVTTKANTIESDLNGTKQTVSSVQSGLNSATSRITTVESGLNGLKTRVSANETAIMKKADGTMVDALSSRVSTCETSLDGFEASLTATNKTVSDNYSSLNSAIAEKKNVVYHKCTSSAGVAGYFHIARCVIKATYANQPITMTITNRGKQNSSMTLIFTNDNSTDPSVAKFQKNGDAVFYIVKADTSTWDLYVQKSESYDSLAVTDFSMGSYASKFTWTWMDKTITSAISGWISATQLAGMYTIDTTSGGTSGSNSLITSGAAFGGISKVQSNLDTTNATVSTHTEQISKHDTRITATESAISLKVSTSDFNSYKTTVTGAISTAKSEAINTASNDATTKANNALSSAKTYTNTQITTVNESLSTTNQEISVMKGQIALKVEQTDIDTAVQSIDNKFASYSTTTQMNSAINQSASSVLTTVEGIYTTKTDTEEQVNAVKADLELKVDKDTLISEINASADVITLTGNRFIVNSDNFQLTADGTMTAVNGIFSGTLNGATGSFSGNISASSGVIGANGKGFYISDSGMYATYSSDNFEKSTKYFSFSKPSANIFDFVFTYDNVDNDIVDKNNGVKESNINYFRVNISYSYSQTVKNSESTNNANGDETTTDTDVVETITDSMTVDIDTSKLVLLSTNVSESENILTYTLSYCVNFESGYSSLDAYIQSILLSYSDDYILQDYSFTSSAYVVFNNINTYACISAKQLKYGQVFEIDEDKVTAKNLKIKDSAITVINNGYQSELSNNCLSLQSSTINSNSYNTVGSNPSILFKNNKNDQNLALIYTDYDSVKAPASLTLVGNQGGEYFIAPNVQVRNKLYVGNGGSNIYYGQYNKTKNLYYATQGYHAFYINGKGVAYIQYNGINMNKNIMFRDNQGITAYDHSNWYMLRCYDAANHSNTVALGNTHLSTSVYTTSSVWYNGSSSTKLSTTSSDKRLKEDFVDIEKYEDMFMDLKPVTYKFHDGLYNVKGTKPLRTWGFVANEVIDAFEKNGLDWKDEELVTIDRDGEYTDEELKYVDNHTMLKMNYQNMISLNTHMIQKTRKEMLYQAGCIDLHETIIQDLQNRIYQLEKQIKEPRQAVV